MPFPYSGNTGPHYINQSTYSWRDAKGNVSRTTWFLDFGAAGAGADVDAAVSGMAAVMAALTNAALQRVAGGHATEYGVAQYGANAGGGAYESVIEKAVLTFQDGSGQLHRYAIPAPKVAIFLADKITVDPANASVVAFKNYVLAPTAAGAFWCSRNDVPLVNFMGGYFASKKLRRRMNILTLTPPLTPGEPAE